MRAEVRLHSSTYRLLLSTTLAEEIERVVVFGRPTLSRPVSRLLARDDLELVVVSTHADWIDPGRSASLVTDAVRLPDAGNGDWFDAWHRADRLVRERLDALLKTQPYLTGPLLAATVWTALDDADALFAGSSARSATWTLRPSRRRPRWSTPTVDFQESTGMSPPPPELRLRWNVRPTPCWEI